MRWRCGMSWPESSSTASGHLVVCRIFRRVPTAEIASKTLRGCDRPAVGFGNSVCLRPRLTYMDLRWVGGNENDRARPVRTAFTFDPCGLHVAELVPVDGDPSSSGLDFLDAEDRDLGCRAASEASVLELLPHALCVRIPDPSTSYFQHPPQSEHRQEHDE